MPTKPTTEPAAPAFAPLDDEAIKTSRPGRTPKPSPMQPFVKAVIDSGVGKGCTFPLTKLADGSFEPSVNTLLAQIRRAEKQLGLPTDTKLRIFDRSESDKPFLGGRLVSSAKQEAAPAEPAK